MVLTKSAIIIKNARYDLDQNFHKRIFREINITKFVCEWHSLYFFSEYCVIYVGGCTYVFITNVVCKEL